MVAYSERRPKLKAIPTELVNQLVFCSLWKAPIPSPGCLGGGGTRQETLSCLSQNPHSTGVFLLKSRSS